MKYIIMCGGDYKHWEKPRHLSVVNGEELVERTIRLLRENGIKDISISSNNPIFEKFGVPVLKHDNLYIAQGFKIEQGNWFNCFYPTNEPVCYLFGDVYFSDEAIKTIIETETDDIEFFGSRPPFSDKYIKNHEEPFALKVVNIEHLRDAINKTKKLEKEGKFWRKPIMWELWTVIKDTPLQVRGDEYPAEYIVINDYTCDVDWKEDIKKIEWILGGDRMVKVKCVVEYNDLKLGKLVKVDEELIVTHDRADYLANERGLVKIIEVIPEPKKEPVKKTGRKKK